MLSTCILSYCAKVRSIDDVFQLQNEAYVGFILASLGCFSFFFFLKDICNHTNSRVGCTLDS